MMPGEAQLALLDSCSEAAAVLVEEMDEAADDAEAGENNE